MSKRSIIGFITGLLLATWAAQVVLIYFVRDLESAAAAPWLAAMMFFPTVAAVSYRFAVNGDAFRPVTFRVGNPIYLVLAAMIPAVSAMMVLGLTLAAGWGSSEYFSFSAGGAEVAKGPWMLGLGQQGWLTFAANVAVTSIAYAAMNSVVAVGEEFGWRGFLQPHLIERFGLIPGVALLGLVWSFWHLPALLAGYNYPDWPLLGGLVLFPAALVGESFVMAWLTIRGRSFWPAVFMHGSINGVQEGIVSKLVFGVPNGRLYADVLASAVALALGAICLGLLLRKRSNRTFLSGRAQA